MKFRVSFRNWFMSWPVWKFFPFSIWNLSTVGINYYNLYLGLFIWKVLIKVDNENGFTIYNNSVKMLLPLFIFSLFFFVVF